MDSRMKRSFITVIILAVLVGSLAAWINIYPDFLWFKMVNYVEVYAKILWTQIGMGVIVGVVYAIILLANLAVLYRFTPAHLSPAFMGGTEFTGGSLGSGSDTRQLIYGGLALLAVLFSIFMGYAASDRWELWLRYQNADGLEFRSATPILAGEASLNSAEIPVSQLELQAKKFQVGDEINVQVDGNEQMARVEAVLENALQLDTTIRIEAGQKAVFTSMAREPIFSKDIAYYVFKMPLERYICGTFFGMFLLVTIFSVVVYFFHGLITGDTSQLRFRPPPAVKAHLFVLVAITLFFRAWNYRFAMFDLLYTSNDVVRAGGGHAAMQARLPILHLLLWLTVLCAVVFLISIFLRGNKFAFGGFAVFIVAGIFGQLYPTLVQTWQVEPNKQTLETKFINYNIKATLQAYGLEANTVTEEEYPLTEELAYSDITGPENASVINSLRLWDWRPLRRTFRQLQELRPQYDFYDVDIDRYTVDDEIRQVMLSARELNINELPTEIKNDWYKQTYTYTHGYGAVLSPVNEIDNGKPNMYIQGLPPIDYEDNWQHRFRDDPGPRIYYGERTDRYVIVHPTREDALEFDYPQEGQQYAVNAYQGKGGVPLKSFWRKLVYMLKFDNAINIVLPGEITPTSRILYERNIKKRVHKIAPFLRYDGDPYIILHNGRLVWMIDAYTVTHRYPYSLSMRELTPRRRSFGPVPPTQRDGEPWGNYIRNSVKVVVDAYDGTVDFYHVAQARDPIAACYERIFPNLFKPFSEMPAALKAHIRYPMGLFLIQANVYRDYHMIDPVTFYAGEDQWEIGRELYDNTDSQSRQAAPPPQASPFAPQPQVTQRSPSNVQDVEPYYVVNRLPGEEKAEFMLMLPFTPRNKPNLTAWLAARCDLPQYGQLLVYRFPKGKLVSGPMQVENFISQEPDISQQISLWNTQGSRVLRGNLLIMPMNNSLLYVEPIYIQSEDEKTAIPELRRVVVGYKENVVWGASLDEALIKMFGADIPAASAATLSEAEVAALPAGETSVPALVEQANRYFNQARAAQRAGKWDEYGRYLEHLEQTLRQLEENAR